MKIVQILIQDQIDEFYFNTISKEILSPSICIYATRKVEQDCDCLILCPGINKHNIIYRGLIFEWGNLTDKKRLKRWLVKG